MIYDSELTRLDAEARAQYCANQNARRGLPPLKGSPRQVEWAECIRYERWEEIMRLFVELCGKGHEDEASELLQRSKMLRLRTDARFWIARRSMSVIGLLEVGASVS